MFTNNFRLVYGECRSKQPPHLEEYKILNGYQVYCSKFSSLIFVIHDHVNNLYCVLEHNGNSVDLDEDIKANLSIIFPDQKN